MKAPWEYFENLDEIVYVVDTEKRELVYMNRYAMEKFKLKSREEYVGAKCYDFLQGLTKPCYFCNTDELAEGKFIEWTHRNPVLQKPFLLKDTLITWEGRTFRMEIGVDMGRGYFAENGLIRYEALVNDCLIETHSTTDPDESIRIMLRFIGEKLNCSRVDIYEMDQGKWLKHTYGWPEREDDDTELAEADKIAYLQEWYETFNHNEPILITDVDKLKVEAPELEQCFQIDDSRTIILVPLLCRKELRGIIRMDDSLIELPKNAAQLGQMLSHFIVSILERRDLMRYLEYLGYHDQLTGALNRHALEERVEDKEDDQPMGLVVCDIIGLKNINDIQGHQGGDRAIRQVYDTLTRVFTAKEIYRTGGDEFLAICHCQEESEFEIQVDLLRREIMANNCSLSVGTAWAGEGGKDFVKLLKLADERMYKEKEEFYAQSDLLTGKPHNKYRGEWSKEQKKRTKDPFQEFISHYYFDVKTFFQSVTPGAEYMPVYHYCGDMQKNIYYISDNLKEDFNFPDNLVQDFITLLEQRIYEEDRERHVVSTRFMLEKKKVWHSIRYRIYNRDREPVWMHCQGILKWNEDQTKPLFFSGTMTLIKEKEKLESKEGGGNLKYALDKIRGEDGENKELMILCFSLHGFSDINQLLGREKGDELIWDISLRITQELGDDFSFVRLGGVRFAVVSDTVLDPDEPVLIIRKIVKEIYRKHQISIIYTCSVGLLRSPRDGSTVSKLLENAEILMNVAADTVEGAYLEFSSSLAKKYHDESELSMALNQCINQKFKGFRIVIQPQVRAKDGKIFGGEVLLRWRYKGEDVAPCRFIPILEKTDLIVPVGKWVAAQTVQLGQRILSVMPDFSLSFNVSYRQVVDQKFFPFIKRVLNTCQVPGKNFMIELTETHFNELPERFDEFIRQCQEIGVRLALDDFGNGYSSLQLLLQYSAEVIKLDRTLMQEITSSDEKMDFIMSVIYACHKFKKKVCVEGVETKEEFEAIQKAECDYIQGFYFYKPMETEDLCRLLEEGE